MLHRVLVVVALSIAACTSTPLKPSNARAPAESVNGHSLISHYAFFASDRTRIADDQFLRTRFDGAQLKYTWRELEPEKDVYALDAIEHDRAALAANGKRLWLQLQDASFDSRTVLVPDYLVDDPAYHGGAAPEYDDEHGAEIAGWVARRWDPAVRERFARLLAVLGAAFDGRIDGINLPETAIEFATHAPADFTPADYAVAVVENMRAMKAAFPTSIAMQYANFMPGEWRPDEDAGYLSNVYRQAEQLGIAVGAPDLLPGKPAQMQHAYHFMHWLGGKRLPIGIAVQDGNYAVINPRVQRPPSANELIAFARQYLHATIMFWSAQEPYYSREVLPLFEAN